MTSIYFPLYGIQRQDPFDKLSDIDVFNVANGNVNEFFFFISGDRNLDTVASRMILIETISFIKVSEG